MNGKVLDAIAKPGMLPRNGSTSAVIAPPMQSTAFSPFTIGAFCADAKKHGHRRSTK
jgi:hypothetical protein